MASLEQGECWNKGIVPYVWSIAPKPLVLVSRGKQGMWTALIPGMHLTLLGSYLEMEKSE